MMDGNFRFAKIEIVLKKKPSPFWVLKIGENEI